MADSFGVLSQKEEIVSLQLLVNWMDLLIRFIQGAQMRFGILSSDSYCRMKFTSNQSQREGLQKSGKGMLMRMYTRRGVSLLGRKMGLQERQSESILLDRRNSKGVRSLRHQSETKSQRRTALIVGCMLQLLLNLESDLMVLTPFQYYQVRKYSMARLYFSINSASSSSHQQISLWMQRIQSQYFSWVYRLNIISHFQQDCQRQSLPIGEYSFTHWVLKIRFSSYSSKKTPSKACLIISPTLPPFQKSPLQMLKQLVMMIMSRSWNFTFQREEMAQSYDPLLKSILVTQSAKSSSLSQNQMNTCRSFKHLSSRNYCTYFSLQCVTFQCQDYTATFRDELTRLRSSFLRESFSWLMLSKISALARQAFSVFLMSMEVVMSLNALMQYPSFIYTKALLQYMVDEQSSDIFTAISRHSLALLQSSTKTKIKAVKQWPIGLFFRMSLPEIISSVVINIS